MTNFGPKNGNSQTKILLIPSKDQLVRYAIIVPIPVPDFQNPTNIGNVRKGPPGVNAPNTVPIDIPLNPDSLPNHCCICSFGRISTSMLDIKNAAIIRYMKPWLGWKS